MAALFGLFGCSSSEPDVEAVRPALTAAVLAVPGVTGGTVGFSYASLSPRATCEVTGEGTTTAELSETLERVLKVVTDHIRPYRVGNATCSISNGGVIVRQTDLGFTSPASFDDLRARFP